MNSAQPGWRGITVIGLLVVLLTGSAAADPIADRRAVEQVYYTHRLGTKPPFDETMPPKLLAELVERETVRERVLKAVYGVEITEALVEAEVRRIETMSKAPEVLAEIQAALGGDRARFLIPHPAEWPNTSASRLGRG